MAIISNDRVILWFQPDGPGTSFEPFGVGEKAGGMTGKSVPGPGRTPVYGRTEFGTPVVIKVNRDAPGDLPSGTVQIYERAQMDVLLKALQKGCPINIQTRIVKCGALNNPNNWDVIDHWAHGEITDYSPGDGPSAEFAGDAIQVEGSISFTHFIRLVNTALSALTTTEADDILSVAGIPDEDCNNCGNGYPGADQILYFGTGSDATTDSDLLYTRNGGGSIAATSAAPFAGSTNFESIDFVALRPISQTQFRIVVATKSSVVGTKAQYAYADVTYGAEGTTVWTTGVLDGTATGDTVEAMDWLIFDRLYIASAGDIYVSTNQANSFPSTAIYTGATVINGFAKSPDEAVVWAFGESNLILRESNQSGVFETRVGPSGGGEFHGLAVAGDGTVYAGNGTAIYKSENQALNAGGWTELYDFGTNKAVVEIQVIGGQRALGGDSQLLRAIVDDTTGASSGTVWQSVDGGASWFQITELANLGYNAAYFSHVSDNDAIIVGDTDAGSTGAIHKLAPVA